MPIGIERTKSKMVAENDKPILKSKQLLMILKKKEKHIVDHKEVVQQIEIKKK